MDVIWFCIALIFFGFILAGICYIFAFVAMLLFTLWPAIIGITVGVFLWQAGHDNLGAIIGLLGIFGTKLWLEKDNHITGSSNFGNTYDNENTEESNASQVDKQSDVNETWLGGGHTGQKGKFTIIKEIQENTFPSGSCTVNWEGNFGFSFESQGEILESDINGPTKFQMGYRIFEKKWSGEWEEE